MTTQLLIRKSHRYLGLFIGIQFLGWTISGLYFSWNDIDKVHGDHMRKSPHYISSDAQIVSPSMAIADLKKLKEVDSIHSIHLISLVGKPIYQIAYFSGHTGDVHPHAQYALADATTGAIRQPLSKKEAIALAKDYVVNEAKMSGVVYLQKTDAHHEYRERPLPAWAISFNDPDCTVYISADLGTFQSIRHDQWRAFDFLWMFHTMDYESRDDINNWLLRVFSIFGLITVLSGFTLFFVSSRTFRKLR
jgi:hypothetical protein